MDLMLSLYQFNNKVLIMFEKKKLGEETLYSSDASFSATISGFLLIRKQFQGFHSREYKNQY